MLQLKNSTPFPATINLLPNVEGIDTLYLTVKATFKIGPEWTLVEEQPLPQEQDVYWGEPITSSLKYASDVHLGKPATDIVMLGLACAPDKTPVRQLDVNLSVGRTGKTVRVYGDRVWDRGAITAPQPFQTMPMMYENAFGGLHQQQDRQFAEERNPVGKGFVGKRSDREMDGQALPNLEEPRQLIRSLDDRPEPACFGYRSPNWHPRATYAGTYDEHWEQYRAPYVPSDFDRRFFNAAHPDLIYDGFLQGGEPVEITGMHPIGKLQFQLPHVKLIARVEINGAIEQPPLLLETLQLEPNQLQLSMIWKAAFQCDKQARKIKQISLNLSR